MTELDSYDAWHEHLGASLPGAQVVFTTRRGGVSGGPFRSLNLGRLTDDRPDAVAANRHRLQEQAGRRLAMVRQVHGSVVHVAGEDWPRADGAPTRFHEGDGVVSDHPELAPAVLVADCLPVALAGGGRVAMLHAGWRGLASGVVDEGVRLLRDRSPGCEIAAAIGPGVGVCCYEVGEEVHRAFARFGPAVRRGPNLDLRGVAQIQLKRAGVDVRHDVDLCTSCSPELFFSHRRDHGVTGRQAGVIWLS